MKILLVGEYNRTHWNLKKALQTMGHQVIVIGFRDGFKKVDVDIELKDTLNSKFLKKLRVITYKLLKLDLLSLSIKRQIKKNKKTLSNCDIVQFLNETPFYIDKKSQLELLSWLTNWNKKSFLLSTGIDYISVSYAYNKKFRYSILTPYFERKVNEKDFRVILDYKSKTQKRISDFMIDKCHGIISKDLDYHIPLLGHEKYLGMIPHSIDLSILEYKAPIIEDKIMIFHGINTINYYKKGNDLFEAALNEISSKYKNKVDILISKDLPYEEYIKSFDKAHILLDQVYAYDQGFNALEAMAKGKVVFTGAEKEWLDYYKIKEDTIAINALPDVAKIVEKLEWLILNPKNIISISKNARAFVEKHHDHINCAKQYLELWTKP